MRTLSIARTVILVVCVAMAVGFTHAASLPLRVERDNQGMRLAADPISEPGALFIFQAPGVTEISARASLLIQTNTPFTFTLPLTYTADSNAFFFALHWPGRCSSEFGNPEDAASFLTPPAILIAVGLPAPLTADNPFVADFFVTDSAGQTPDISGPVHLAVIRVSDGTPHPDATVTVADQLLAHGHFQAELVIRAETSLNGYTLAVAPITYGGITLPRLQPFLNLPAQALPSLSALPLIDFLQTARLGAADSNPNWQSPLGSTNWRVAGTYGEWRGQFNQDVHAGVDLSPAANAPVIAARGGTVSCIATHGTLGVVVVDHGDGWFSRYAGLDPSQITVAPGAQVTRGGVLATALAMDNSNGPRLHFEIRRGDGAPRWGDAAPGASRDPLQISGAFTPPPGSATAQLYMAGLTSARPSENSFVRLPPAQPGNGGSIFLVAQFAEKEPAFGASRWVLGPRAVTFQPEGSASVVLQPTNDASIAALLNPAGDAGGGFAKYDLFHALNPDHLNWFRYWWKWNTGVYATNPIGPRSILLTAQTYYGATTTNRLSYGPEIRDNVWQPLANGSFKITIVAHLGATNLAPQCAQPDQYRLEILRTNRTPIAGAYWENALPGNSSQVFYGHLDTADYTFHLPAGESPGNLVIRASSLLNPDLRHEISQGVVQLLGRASNAPALLDIPAGTYLMGSPASEAERSQSEGPQTMVILTNSFKMSRYPITQSQYRSVTGSNPSYFSGVSNRPVEQVSWNDATNYCYLLTQQERQAGYLPTNWTYRLPTEAEWEYACRAGNTNAFSYGPSLLSGMANFNGHYEYNATNGTTLKTNGIFPGSPVPVGVYLPNSWGLYDMQGNVWEWCKDAWASNLPGGSVTNPCTVAAGTDRVLRGGGWYCDGQFCRSAFRLRSSATYRGNDTGFRIVLAPN